MNVLASPKYYLSPREVAVYGLLAYGKPIQVLTGYERDSNGNITVSDFTESATISNPPAVRAVWWEDHYERAYLQGST